jgi:hypothetical protein
VADDLIVRHPPRTHAGDHGSASPPWPRLAGGGRGRAPPSRGELVRTTVGRWWLASSESTVGPAQLGERASDPRQGWRQLRYLSSFNFFHVGWMDDMDLL